MGLKWYNPLYTDSKTQRKEARIRWLLDHGAGSFQLYLLTLSTSPGMQLDIVRAAELKQKVIRRRLPLIVGVASSYENALELLEEIAEDVLRRTGTVQIREYFEDRQG